MEIPLSRYWSLLSGYLKGQRGLFTLLVILLIASIGSRILVPQVTRAFIDGALAGHETAELVWLALLFIGIAVVHHLLAVGATWSGEVVAWNATNRLRVDVAGHSLSLDMAFHKGKTPGEMIQRLDEDVTALARFFSQLVIMIGGNLLLMVGILVMFFLESLWLGIVFTVFSICSVFVLNRLREFVIPHEMARRKVLADLLGYIEERLSGTEDVRSSGAVDYVINGLYRLHSRLLHHWKRTQLRYWMLGAVSRVITLAGLSIAFVCAYYLFSNGTISVGTAFLIVQYLNMLARPLRELSSQVEGLQGVGASIERIGELMDEKPRIQDGIGQRLPPGPLTLNLEGVSFGYDANEPVLRDLSLDLAPGKVLGILGRTGSGKTTLSRLVFRLYDTREGTIRLGGENIRDLQIADLRHRVALVTQDIQLFLASVRDNLTFFTPGTEDRDILDVLEQVELMDWYRRLPDGLDTRIETGGRSMSAGEAQLLAFARVFLRDPGLVILDEASSRLDPATEARIERAMNRLLAGRTAILIAHRLGTVKRADEILILEGGAVVEHGNRVSLEQDPSSRFSALLRMGLNHTMDSPAEAQHHATDSF